MIVDPHEFRYFDLWDYIVFGGMLLVSALIGVYFAFFAEQKQNTTSEYLMGGKKMGIFPISMSLIASYISGIALIGLPSEVYVYGTQLWVLVIAEIVTAIVMSYVIIPVFYNLQIVSTYEYLNQRFSPVCRTVGSVFFILKMMLYMPIVIYVPALAFSQVSGFSLEILIPTICIVCIFYTTLGGIKAVVWTDTIQTILMVAGVVTVAVMGTHDVGGVSEVWKRSKEGGRLDFFNFSWDPTIRHTFWNVLIGKFFQHMAACTINQAMVQRCLAMPSLNKAKITIAIYAIGISSLVNLCCYTGLVVFAAFYDCDPVKTGVIKKADQLLPYFVMKVTSHIPCLPGIFVSGVFSAALSTMSTGLNSMCGVILEDFIRPLQKKPISEERASFYMKVITVILGAVCVLLAFVVDKLGGLIQFEMPSREAQAIYKDTIYKDKDLTSFWMDAKKLYPTISLIALKILMTAGSLSGITAGTLLGMFLLGMLFPWANAKGALVGGTCAATLVSWLCAGSQIAVTQKRLVFPTKPISIDGCNNSTYDYFPGIEAGLEIKEETLIFFRISYLYYTLIGMVTVIVVGMIVSYFTGFNDPSTMDPNVFSPVIKKYFEPKKKGKIIHPVEEGKMAIITEKQFIPLLQEPTR